MLMVACRMLALCSRLEKDPDTKLHGQFGYYEWLGGQADMEIALLAKARQKHEEAVRLYGGEQNNPV